MKSLTLEQRLQQITEKRNSLEEKNKALAEQEKKIRQELQRQRKKEMDKLYKEIGQKLCSLEEDQLTYLPESVLEKVLSVKELQR